LARLLRPKLEIAAPCSCEAFLDSHPGGSTTPLLFVMPFRDGAASPTDRRSTSPRRQAPTRQDLPPAAAGELPTDPTLAAILAAVHAGTAKATDNIDKLSDKIDTNNKKLDQMGDILKGQGEELQQHSTDLKTMAERISVLEKGQASGLTRTVSAPELRRSDAAPTKADFKDLAKVRISANEYFPREALIDVLDKMLEEANLTLSEYEVTPKANCGKDYTLTFKGESASVKARQFLDSMRLKEGGWKRHTVARPDNSSEPLYFNPDKSSNEKARERKLKILHQLLQQALPDAQFTKKIRDGNILIGGWTTASTLLRDGTIKWGTTPQITKEIKDSVEKLFNDRISSFRP